MSSFFASLSAAQKAETAEVHNQATEAFPSMKDLTDALVGGSGWLQNPETVNRKRVEKHLEEEANLDYEDDDEDDDGDEGDEGDSCSTNDSDSEFDLDLDSESEFPDSDYDPGVCQSAAVQWLDALHPVIWMAEIQKYFEDDFLPAFLLTGEQVSPVQLYKYKVIVTSYHQVSAELGRIQNYYSLLKAARSGSIQVSDYPARPNLCLLSGMSELPETKPLGPVLILNEVHAIKTMHSPTYRAIFNLRDSFALLSLLRGHQIHTLGAMRAVFANGGTHRTNDVPAGCLMIRLIQLLDAVTPKTVWHPKNSRNRSIRAHTTLYMLKLSKKWFIEFMEDEHPEVDAQAELFASDSHESDHILLQEYSRYLARSRVGILANNLKMQSHLKEAYSIVSHYEDKSHMKRRRLGKGSADQ
ncbi:global transactivator [Fusarium mexicanum]|uniref:Global transactivator n=1 Tax=Fusarium mexicanum TaxID=751941 RepID=A0A8H5I646_9HYPO|nr:global transactivator [Fusarium mexicanum]